MLVSRDLPVVGFIDVFHLPRRACRAFARALRPVSSLLMERIGQQAGSGLKCNDTLILAGNANPACILVVFERPRPPHIRIWRSLPPDGPSVAPVKPALLGACRLPAV
ncbi:hypothetical protein AZF01_05910 [Martelella sp. AD-3]|nr:hypothetical protein AZF01_05910 [Martelella sp. AD-3]